MEIEVLGCHGGEMPGFLAPSLLIDDTLILDAGTFSSVLSLERQLRIEHFLLSHAHHDHVKDLAAFADLIIGRRHRPVTIHATAEALTVLRQDFFNNRLWPDFFSLPNQDRPILRGAVFAPNTTFSIGDLRVRAIPVSHPVETVGFIVRGPSGSFVYTGDTGPTEALWRAVNRLQSLKLLMIETKFPNELQLVADASGHLTPQTLSFELKKLQIDGVPIFVYHIKPDRYATVVAEVRSLGDERLRFMQIGDRYQV